MPSLLASGTAVPVANIRTVALVGSSASGKTTLSEALLATAGAITAPGSVERGSTVSDADPLERRLQHSLQSSLMHLRWHDCRVHLVDTPGGADFIGQSLPALEAVETAAVVISAAAGIEPMAVRMMQYAAERQLDVLADLQRSRPMDRLVCGDVGYGKTEVAVRAAFRVVMEGKQAAVLVPTGWMGRAPVCISST